ncbi:hypothetical protein Esi_0060_0121 [Ectocarpus siliculosus]|uniref:Uncharacterized protein n=1 Tax=Ectocarpus siliculosus TaxID=2880 RepID=D8LQV6_ECTSI|nr:hypothetical protein Esi_0060_0121 [Ectocarpus siliculosus]|eukprot:CBN74983.1 hypothetical protein Esi_0060_0121 [Ectocarpus siliculosus]
MFFEIAMERLLSAVIASIMMPYWGWDGCNFVAFALLVTAILAGSIFFSLMIWGLVTKMIQQGVSSLRRRLRSGARPDGGVVAEPGDTTAEHAREQQRPERQGPSHGRAHLAGRATLRVRDRQRAQPQPQQQQRRHVPQEPREAQQGQQQQLRQEMQEPMDKVRLPEHLAMSRQRLDQERWLERSRYLTAQMKLLDRDKKAKHEHEWLERNPNRYAQALHQNWEKKVKQEQQTRERKKLQQQEREREAQQGQKQLRQEKQETMNKACNRVHNKVELPCLRDQVRLPEYLAKSRKRSDQERLERIRIGVAQACQQDREKNAKLEQQKRERKKLQQQERELQENQQRRRQQEADEQAKTQQQDLDLLLEQGYQHLLQREREQEQQQQQQREKKKLERQQQEREWERKKMARQQELEQLKLRQQEQERKRKKKVEQEREAYFSGLWQREQEREQEWEQKREQERERRAQKKMQQEREWERKKMARQQELEQLKLRQQEQERKRKKKVEQEREAYFSGLWQREQEREQEWEQKREQERERRAQKKMQQEREWERKKMARQQELEQEQLKLRQQEQERERKKKVEQEREAYFSGLWQREQEREQEWEQKREQERERRAQKKMQQEREWEKKKMARQQEQEQLKLRQQEQERERKKKVEQEREAYFGRDAGATSGTPTEPRRGTTSVLTTTVKRALRMAGTEAEARRITLSAVLRNDKDVPGSSTGLPQQQIRERVEHTLDFLCSPEASGLGRKRRMGSGRKVIKTIFWAHVGAIARQRRLAKADALPGSAEKRQGRNTGGVLPAPRDSSPRGQEQREALGQHERQQRGIPQTTIEARPLPGLTRDFRTIQVEHPPKSSSAGFSLGREATRQEMESSFLTTTHGGKTVNALPFLPIPPVGPLAGRRGGAFGALTTVEARPLPGLTRGDPLKVEHPPKGSSGGFSVGREATRQEAQSFLKTNSGGKTVDALPFLRIPPQEKPATPTVAIPAASVTAAAAAAVPVPTGTEENPIHGTDSAPVTAAAAAAVRVPTGTEENPIHGTDSAPVTAAAAAAVPVPTGTEENPTHGTVSAYVTAAAAAAVSVTTGAKEDPTHGTVSAPVAAAASAVPVTTTGIEAVSQDGAEFSSANQTFVACTVMSIPDLPEYEEQRAAQEAQIRRNRPATKTDPPAPDTTVGNTPSASTAAPVTPKTEQPFERVKQGKWRVLTADYLSTDSEDGSGEEDGWG